MQAGVSGQLNNAGDALVLALLGTQYADATFALSTAVPQSLEFDYSFDGVNWIPSGQGAPYIRRIDLPATNPATVFGSSATVGGIAQSFDISSYGPSRWSLPLPGNAQWVRILALSSGPNSVALNFGMRWTEETPVCGTLFDVTSLANKALSTGVLHTLGWRHLLGYVATPAGGSALIQSVDVNGNPISVLTVGANATARILIAEDGGTSQGNIAANNTGWTTLPGIDEAQIWSATSRPTAGSRIWIQCRR